LREVTIHKKEILCACSDCRKVKGEKLIVDKKVYRLNMYANSYGDYYYEYEEV
jgi:hypothetical protein